MDNTIKSLTITGSAAVDAMKPRRGSRRKRPTDQIDKDDDTERIVFGQRAPVVSVVVPVVPQVIHTPPIHVKPQVHHVNPQVHHVNPHVHHVKPQVHHVNPQVHHVKPHVQAQVHHVKPHVIHQEVAQLIEGGKVILNPPKHSRVKLQPKVVHHSQPTIVNQTRKARRIHLVNLTHRFTRAKRVHDDTEKKPMDTIREYLIQKGVIQAKSKAPEKMLRSMYSDFMLLKDQAL